MLVVMAIRHNGTTLNELNPPCKCLLVCFSEIGFKTACPMVNKFATSADEDIKKLTGYCRSNYRCSSGEIVIKNIWPLLSLDNGTILNEENVCVHDTCSQESSLLPRLLYRYKQVHF